MTDLRKPFFEEMCKIAEADPKVILIVGDLGYSFCEEYVMRFPRQFLNIGCMEQSMVGIAAGMARGGLKPYVYSGSVFLLMRAYEQIRDDVCYNDLDVKLIGTGAAGFLGFTHNYQGTENEHDLTKNLPNISLFDHKYSPEERIDRLHYRGPVFIRL